MQTFNELEFVPQIDEDTLLQLQAMHKSHPWQWYRAIMKFPNGHHISVVKSSKDWYGDGRVYEIAIMKDGSFCENEDGYEQIYGMIGPDEVTEIMREVQARQ